MNRPWTLLLACAVGLDLAAGLDAVGGTAGRTDAEMLRTPIYTAEGDAIVRHNGDRFNNRPLYGNQNNAIVLTGDRPLVRLANGSMLNGTFMAALFRGKQAVWLHEFSDITSKYRPGRMEWTVQHAAFGATKLTLDAVPMAATSGMALRLRVEGAQPGDRLLWAFGGAAAQGKSVLDVWDVTTSGRQKTLAKGFASSDCSSNRVALESDRYVVSVGAGKSASSVSAACSATSRVVVADAGEWSDPLRLLSSTATERPLACSVVPLEGRTEVCWVMQAFTPAAHKTAPRTKSPSEEFAAGLKRVVDVEHRVTVHTPDARLDAMVAASGAVMDGVFREGIFTHAGMRWGVPLLGWRTMYGGTAYGWHDRVLTQARTCLARQITDNSRSVPVADPRNGLSCESTNSRLFGRGRVNIYHPWHYDMQTQFFDQLIHAWRWTGDAELEKLLRPALELHLEYIHDCFDPDDDGLYESYANTWPTDDQWYNGGGTAEETAYAYAGHKAALELARHADDTAAAARHQARLAKIHDRFMRKLWIPSKGYVGSYVEQGGHGRLHEDPWLYAIFCPIDAGMLTDLQAASALYFTEWGLEREKMPYGGQRCWTSNWVPSLWSLREMWPGDNYHLALAYFQTGLADDGWDILRGTFPLMAFYGPVPGDLGYPNGATDFNDCASMFCRTVVEGLFGYRPDYPNGVVTIAPQLPSTWTNASIKTPDVLLAIDGSRYRIELARPAAMDLRLPVSARKLTTVTVNGSPAKWELLPGFGCSIAKIAIPATNAVTVELSREQPVAQAAAVALRTDIGAKKLALPLEDARLLEPVALPTTAGHHLVQALVQVGDAPQRRQFKVEATDQRAEAEESARTFASVPADAKWDSIDLSRVFNADVRAIFQQKYLSPRPATCSLRLATDGYSTWQEMLNPKHKAPEIDLTAVAALLDPSKRLRTQQGVPFVWSGGASNIAFTSMWDNWPRQVVVPVNRAGEGIWLLVCGFTPPMQGRIANAGLRLTYGDGVVETIDLVPPFNFWSLCPFGGVDYDYARDGFCLPKTPPQTVQLGGNCRAILLNRRLRPGIALASVTLETYSQEAIIGLMGLTVMNPAQVGR